MAIVRQETCQHNGIRIANLTKYQATQRGGAISSDVEELFALPQLYREGIVADET
jgi:hypothetical protein